jgi:N-acetylglucosamine-6-sulfatase
MSRRRPHGLFFVAGVTAAVLLGVGLVVLGLDPSPDRGRADPTERPNIVVIETDDQTLASLNRRTMPATMSLLADRGTTFTDYVVSSPLCCPSRATLLTGQYPHNHGIVSNSPGYSDLRDERNTLPTWLRRAGYVTAHVGKYLNNYERDAESGSEAAPGWDEWVTMLPPYSYFDYALAINGTTRSFGDGAPEYLTTVLNRRAARIVKERMPGPAPLYLQVDQLAPHGQSEQEEGSCGLTATPLPGDFRRFAREQLPRPPSFDEDDLSDKPPFRRLLERLPPGRVESMRDNYRCRLASIRAVDRGVRRLHAAVKFTGQLDRTVFIFTSDNGFLQGEHRVPAQKAQAYEEAVRVPMVIRAPSGVRGGIDRAAEVDVATANIDIAPTILDLASATPCREPGSCRTMDGRSLVGLLRGRTGHWPENRGILLSFTSGHRRNVRSESCRFSGIRTHDRSYVEHVSVPDAQTGACRPTYERELYDLERDPFQLENLDREGGPEWGRREAAALATRLFELERCAGVEGRDAERDGAPFCE